MFGDFLFEFDLFALGDLGDLNAIQGLAKVVADFLDAVCTFAAVVIEDGFGFDVAIGKGASDTFGVYFVKVEDGFDDLFVSNIRIFGHDLVDASHDAFVTQ